MMQAEFVNAFSVEAVRGSVENAKEYLDLCLTREGWEAVQSCYRGNKLDSILSGSNRHEVFARWVLSHKRIVVRLYNFFAWRRMMRIYAIDRQIQALQLDKMLT